ncbi:hypothetical protein PMAG_a4107 [Pseudoalteromonas mariniglutinosa NCIMB 1770]|nr:hypothetical protein [Pseudoalteromonas mariniglutinosa NCIMB 1770]
MFALSYSKGDVIVSRHCLVSNGGFFITRFYTTRFAVLSW